MSALRIFTIVFLVSNTLACISQTEFEYPDFDIKLFPESPGVCPTSPTKVTCIQDFNSYKWQLNTQSQTEILTGKSVSITSPGVYTLTVEKEVNSILCSEEFEFIVHDLSDPIQIEKYLQGNGFYSIPIFVNQPTSVGDKINSLRQSCDFLPFRFSNDFDYMDSEDIEVIIQEQFQTFNAFYPLTDLNYISTTNDCFCDEGISNLETDFNSLGGRFWVHSYLQDVEDEQGKLYLKSHNSFVGDIPIDKEHENHLKEISNLIIDDDLNNSDIAKATLKHFEVIFKNTSIGKPFNNYNDIPKCVHQSDIYNSYLIDCRVTARFL